MAKGIIIAIIVLAVLVVGVVIFTQFGSKSGETGTGTQGGQQGQTQEEQQEETPATQPSVKEFVIEADDYGFYMNSADINSISANSGETLKITFNVRSTRVYYAGLDFRGCTLNTGKVNPGGSITTEFIAVNACTITSYWPSSGVV